MGVPHCVTKVAVFKTMLDVDSHIFIAGIRLDLSCIRERISEVRMVSAGYEHPATCIGKILEFLDDLLSLKFVRSIQDQVRLLFATYFSESQRQRS